MINALPDLEMKQEHTTVRGTKSRFLSAIEYIGFKHFVPEMSTYVEVCVHAYEAAEYFKLFKEEPSVIYWRVGGKSYVKGWYARETGNPSHISFLSGTPVLEVL